jgi:hypothetical protein
MSTCDYFVPPENAQHGGATTLYRVTTDFGTPAWIFCNVPVSMMSGGYVCFAPDRKDPFLAAARSRPAAPAADIPRQDGGASDPSAPGRPSPVQDEQDEALLALARRAAVEH